MMPEATHTSFIITAYAATVIVVVGLCLWVMLDYRAQRRSLADLERRGIARRSAAPRPEPSPKNAREKA
jgi:heme exporter protein D